MALSVHQGDARRRRAAADRARVLHAGQLLHRQMGLRSPPAQKGPAGRWKDSCAMSALDVRAVTVGPVQENSSTVRASPDATRAVIVDPGDEPQRLLQAIDALGVQIEAILITH